MAMGLIKFLSVALWTRDSVYKVAKDYFERFPHLRNGLTASALQQELPAVGLTPDNDGCELPGGFSDSDFSPDEDGPDPATLAADGTRLSVYQRKEVEANIFTIGIHVASPRFNALDEDFSTYEKEDIIQEEMARPTRLCGPDLECFACGIRPRNKKGVSLSTKLQQVTASSCHYARCVPSLVSTPRT